MAVGPIHHRGDGEAAGEWGGCGGDRGHWRFWIGWGWEVGEFIRNGGRTGLESGGGLCLKKLDQHRGMLGSK